MAENKKGFVLYADLIHTVEKMNDVKAGKLFKTILRYVNDQNPLINDDLVDLIFEPIKQQLKRDLKKYEGIKLKRSEAGVKSAEIKKQQKLTNSTSVDFVQHPSTNSTVRDKDTVTDTVTDKDIYLKRENLTESILDDLENSTHLELVCKRTGFSLEQVKVKLPDFKKIAEAEYIKPMDLVSHLIRWLNKNPPVNPDKPKMVW